MRALLGLALARARIGQLGAGVLLPSVDFWGALLEDPEEGDHPSGPSVVHEGDAGAPEEPVALFTHVGRYYALSHNLKEHCAPWLGMEWGYVQGDIGDPWAQLTVTNDYARVAGSGWVHCDELLGFGKTESIAASSAQALLEVVGGRLDPDDTPFDDHPSGPAVQHDMGPSPAELLQQVEERAQLHDCQQARGTGPVEMCMLPAGRVLVFDMVGVVWLTLLWFLCCRGRRRALPQGGPVAVPCFEGLAVGTRNPQTLRDFRDVGFCNCCFQSLCSVWVCATQGVWPALRAVATFWECICCFDLMWAETVTKAKVFPAVHAYLIALGLTALFFVVRYFHPNAGAAVVVLFAVVRMLARPKIREGKDGDGQVTCLDCAAHVAASECGCCCAIVQEAEFVELHPWYADFSGDPWGYGKAEEW